MAERSNKNEQKDRKLAVMGTVSFFSVLFVLFLIFGFVTPLPLPDEEGIEVIIGDTDVGVDIPAPKINNNMPTNPRPQPSSQAASEQNEEVETQDTEEAPVIKPDENTSDPGPAEEETEIQNTEQNNTDEESEDTEPERQSDSRYEMDGDIFSSGDDDEEGVKGNPKGKTKGQYADGSGIGWELDMDGRGLLNNPPPIQATYNKPEVVVLELIVDRKGNVISVKPRCKGATICDEEHILVKKAIQAAFKLEIEEDMDAIAEQRGYFTFEFNPK